MNNSIKFSINKKDSGQRLDVFLSKKISHLTRSLLKKIIERGNVKINKKIINSPSKKLKEDEQISLNLIIKNSDKLIPNKIKLDIHYEDKDILIINKPKGMVVHPGAGNFENTLANALFYKYQNKLSDINGTLRPGIIHRIDKDKAAYLLLQKTIYLIQKLENNLANILLKENINA